jgi:hypothetical protein
LGIIFPALTTCLAHTLVWHWDVAITFRRSHTQLHEHVYPDDTKCRLEIIATTSVLIDVLSLRSK